MVITTKPRCEDKEEFFRFLVKVGESSWQNFQQSSDKDRLSCTRASNLQEIKKFMVVFHSIEDFILLRFQLLGPGCHGISIRWCYLWWLCNVSGFWVARLSSPQLVSQPPTRAIPHSCDQAYLWYPGLARPVKVLPYVWPKDDNVFFGLRTAIFLVCFLFETHT
jgi:hypothetical protein